MPNQGQIGIATRQVVYGVTVPRAAAVLPATATTTPYWTVAGGLVWVTGLVGICTAAGDATATTLLFEAVPTVGAKNNMCGASASLASMVIGGLVSLDGTAITTALQASGVTVGGNIGGQAKPVMVGVGTINALTANTNATLAFRFVLMYVPIDDGASIAAA